MKPVSRREFFRTTALVGLGTFAAACAKKMKIVTADPQSLARISNGRKQTVGIMTSGTEILSKEPDRLVFLLQDPITNTYVIAPSVTVWIAQDKTSKAIGPLTASFHDE